MKIAFVLAFAALAGGCSVLANTAGSCSFVDVNGVSTWVCEGNRTAPTPVPVPIKE